MQTEITGEIEQIFKFKMSDDEVLQVDKAIYITLSAVKKALRSDVTDRITFLENKKDKVNVFMVIA